MFPKKPYKKHKPTRAKRGQFSKKDIEKVEERDGGACILCHEPAEEIHHIIYKSQNGRGVFTNAASLCRICHIAAHSDADIRKTLEMWARNLYGPNYYKDQYDN